MEYDVVVIGAGNGGLASAIDSVRAGKKTLLIEQHNLPGGCASSFVRGRFEFEPSLHELCAIGSEGTSSTVTSLYRDAGVEMDWATVPDCFRAISRFSDGGEMDVTMPAGREAFRDRLEEYVPGSRESIGKLFSLIDECMEGLDYFSEKTEYDVKYALKTYPNMLRVGSYSSLRVFKALGIPSRAIDILAVYWNYLGVDLENLSFLHYASMVRSYIFDGASIPRHTSHEMSEKLVAAFRRMGGEVWYSTKATEILFDGDKVSGVRTTMGDVKARAVMANMNSNILYGSLVPADKVPVRLRKLSSARKSRFGGRMITAYFGLDAAPEELGIKDYSIFLMGTADSRKEYDSMMKGRESNDFSIFLCYNIVNPEASPKGTAMSSFTTFASPEEWTCPAAKDYFTMKDLWAEKFLDGLKAKAGIDLRGHIEELEVATPMTFARYLGSPEGSAYGHETTGWDDIISRSMSMEKDYPIKGLYLVGTDGPRGDGYPTAYATGRLLAKVMLQEMEGGRI